MPDPSVDAGLIKSSTLRWLIEGVCKALNIHAVGSGVTIQDYPSGLGIRLALPAAAAVVGEALQICTLAQIGGNDGSYSGTLTTLSSWTYNAANTATNTTFCTAQALTFPRYSGAGVVPATEGLILRGINGKYSIIDSNEHQPQVLNCSA